MLREPESTYVPHAAYEPDYDDPFGDPFDSSNEYNQEYSERFENTERTEYAEGSNLSAATEGVQNCMRYFGILFIISAKCLWENIGFSMYRTHSNPKSFINIVG